MSELYQEFIKILKMHQLPDTIKHFEREERDRAGSELKPNAVFTQATIMERRRLFYSFHDVQLPESG